MTPWMVWWKSQKVPCSWTWQSTLVTLELYSMVSASERARTVGSGVGLHLLADVRNREIMWYVVVFMLLLLFSIHYHWHPNFLNTESVTTTMCISCNFLLHTVVDCGLLASPTNGMVDISAGTLLGQMATYSCDSGYMLNGVSSRECTRFGEWSNQPPTCQGIMYATKHYRKFLTKKKQHFSLSSSLYQFS